MIKNCRKHKKFINFKNSGVIETILIDFVPFLPPFLVLPSWNT